ncbi:MAG: DMT family transporter [Thermoplasmata archaeon]|jgi:drug/metabolite transporter (DMT)-like permease|nr:DMT family transporter [Thermoplasmata archaeon]
MSDHSKAYLAIGIAMVSVSFASILIRWSDTPPFVLAAYRLAFAAAILAPLLALTGGFSEIKGFSRQELALVVLSGVALTFHFGLWVVSLGLTLVSTSVILVTSHPIFVAAVQHFLMKERVRRVAVVGIVIAFSGVVLISITDYRLGGGTLAGDAFAFLGGLCAGVYFLSGRVARRTLSVAPYAFSVYGLAAVLLFVSGALAGDVLLVTDGRELTLFVLMAIVPTIFGHTMFNYALKKVPAHIISTSVLGEPVGASLLAFALLPGEVPTVWIVLGGALVVGGLYLVLMLGYDRSDG